MKQNILCPAALGLAAGLFFCILLATPAAADEQKDLLSQTVDSARQQLEQEQYTLEKLQDEQIQTQESIILLEGRAEELKCHLEQITSALQQAQTELSAAQAAEDTARRALELTQTAYDTALADCKIQMRAMQRMDNGGSLALLTQMKSLYQLLSFPSVLRQMSARNSAVLQELDVQVTALETQRRQASAAAAKAESARAALEEQQLQILCAQKELADSLLEANRALDARQAAAEAQSVVTELAKAAYRQATAALDAYAKEQSRKYTAPDLHCSLNFGPVLQSYSSITCRFSAPDAIDGSRHNGTDFAASGGTPVYATADGVVSIAATRPSYGNVVQISHGTSGDGRLYDTLYAHLQSFCVSAGQTVCKGTCIGYVGNTGEVRGQNGGYHLHLELRIDGVRTDALRYIPA